jgi:hypothetical protein
MKYRKIECNMFIYFLKWSDTYHDTMTCYLMDQDSFPFHNQANVMNIVVGDMWTSLKKRGAL